MQTTVTNHPYVRKSTRDTPLHTGPFSAFSHTQQIVWRVESRLQFATTLPLTYVRESGILPGGGSEDSVKWSGLQTPYRVHGVLHPSRSSDGDNDPTRSVHYKTKSL